MWVNTVLQQSRNKHEHSQVYYPFFCRFSFSYRKPGFKYRSATRRRKSQINMKRNRTAYLHNSPSFNPLSADLCDHALSSAQEMYRMSACASCSPTGQIRSRDGGRQRESLGESHSPQDLTLATG